MTDNQSFKVGGREEMYRIVAEHTSDTIVVVDSEEVVRYVSPSIRSQSGYSVEEYEGMDAFAIIVQEDRERVRQSLIQAVQTQTPVDIGYQVQHADGRILDAETKVMPVLHGDGTVNYVVAVVRDVTARKQAERLLENILDNVNAAVWSTDKDFSHYNFFSESVEKISGLPREEIVRSPIRLHDHIHPDDNALLMGEVKEKLDRGLTVRQEFRWIHHPGEPRWGQLIIHPHLDNEGAVERLDGIMLDITDKKRAEIALEESEQRYKSLFEHNLDGVFSIVLEGLYFAHANNAFEQITGIRRETMTNQCFIGMIFDEDHGSVYETLFEVMKEGAPRGVECRLADMTGGERIVSITFVPIILSGQLNGIHGIIKDITKRKQGERELIRSEERSNFLQSSLNRLSEDLAGVMKVSELEDRLIDEVRAVLRVSDVSIVEAEDRTSFVSESSGGELDAHTLRVRIGEKPQPVWLAIGLDRPLPEPEKKWLDTAVRYVTILYDNLYRTEDLMKRMEEMMTGSETPRWMLRLLFKLSEKERASLSSDLHDSVLQDLIIWYRKLESLRSSKSFDAGTGSELAEIEEGLLDAIHQIRITCNELRPPFLLKMGLVESLKSLFAYSRMFANYEIEFQADEMAGPLDEDQILGVYRIVQELLNNATKHSRALKVTMSLANEGGDIAFRYSDDGVGVRLSQLEGSFQHMGIAGIEKRVQSLEGKVDFRSAPGKGFHVTIRFPKHTTER
ncbi:PAS domain S-box protein [Cohnella yongneupensis]|uniref:histidine kinase n=1 Tax=Cohnella yongneupensis TaxID=425006 RepID=A0ABW0QZC9_9BACL